MFYVMPGLQCKSDCVHILFSDGGVDDFASMSCGPPCDVNRWAQTCTAHCLEEAYTPDVGFRSCLCSFNMCNGVATCNCHVVSVQFVIIATLVIFFNAE